MHIFLCMWIPFFNSFEWKRAGHVEFPGWKPNKYVKAPNNLDHKKRAVWQSRICSFYFTHWSGRGDLNAPEAHKPLHGMAFYSIWESIHLWLIRSLIHSAIFVPGRILKLFLFLSQICNREMFLCGLHQNLSTTDHSLSFGIYAPSGGEKDYW